MRSAKEFIAIDADNAILAWLNKELDPPFTPDASVRNIHFICRMHGFNVALDESGERLVWREA